MPTIAPGLRHAITRDAISWRTYLAFRLPFNITVAVGREWR
jgi:hypothetical protein